MSQPQPSGAGIALLRSVALRAETAIRLESELQTTLLRSIVGATVTIFDAEAASIALHRPATNTLEFVVAAGAQGKGVVGLAIPASQGIVGYAFTSGEPISISEPEHDPRFGKDVSSETGYVPRSILAVPMRSDARIAGVLEVLDKRSGSFSMRDIELASAFADQAAVAIAVGARALEAQGLLRMLLGEGIDEEDGQELEALISAATRAQSGDDRYWEFVDAVAGMRLERPVDRTLAIEVLDVVRRHTAAGPRLGTGNRLRR